MQKAKFICIFTKYCSLQWVSWSSST